MPRVLHALEINIQGDEEAIAALHEVSRQLHGKIIMDGMQTIVEHVALQVAEWAPKWTGTIIKNIDTDVYLSSVAEPEIIGEVFSTEHYAPYMERGWEAGYFPNVDNLMAWAFDHNIDEWALAISLFARGFPEPSRFYSRALGELEHWVEGADVAGLATLVGEVIEHYWAEEA